MCESQERRLIIFVSDFKLDFSVQVELVLRLLQEMMQYVESSGHIIAFAFVPYVPTYSRDFSTKPSFSQEPDHTNYLVTIIEQNLRQIEPPRNLFL